MRTIRLVFEQYNKVVYRWQDEAKVCDCVEIGETIRRVAGELAVHLRALQMLESGYYDLYLLNEDGSLIDTETLIA